jgi:N,N'-diacetyllegionaminate synthase
MKTFIIAEVGANHNKNYNQALQLINVAKNSGATAVKFQTYSSETLYVKNTPNFAGYININELIKNIELPREWQKDLKNYCDSLDIEFMSTPFDEKAVEELVNLGVKKLKIAGFESTDFRFVEMVASAKLPLIISLGIGFKYEWLDKLLKLVSKYTNDVTLLHCNNAYPTPMKDIGLTTIKTLAADIRYKTGFSDHTTSTLTPSLAVALGATTIEKHFTLSKHLPGPDHPFALEPSELKEMVDLIVQTELSMIPQSNDLSESEKPFSNAMRSVVSKCIIKKGEIFTVNNITTKRPFLENSIPAYKFENILGEIAEKDYDEDSFI